MATQWRMVRLPAELADRLATMATEMEAAHVAGRATLPAEFCERVPLHHVIERALAEMESHRVRARAPKRPRART